MAKVEHSADARVLVGIDISKHRHEVLIAVPGKSRRRHMTITNRTEDFVRLIASLRDYGIPVRIGFEATGNYHRVLMYHLGVAGFDLKLVSSVALARTREALHNSRDQPSAASVVEVDGVCDRAVPSAAQNSESCTQVRDSQFCAGECHRDPFKVDARNGDSERA